MIGSVMNSSFDNVVNAFSCFSDVSKRQPEYGEQQLQRTKVSWSWSSIGRSDSCIAGSGSRRGRSKWSGLSSEELLAKLWTKCRPELHVFVRRGSPKDNELRKKSRICVRPFCYRFGLADTLTTYCPNCKKGNSFRNAVSAGYQRSKSPRDF